MTLRRCALLSRSSDLCDENTYYSLPYPVITGFYRAKTQAALGPGAPISSLNARGIANIPRPGHITSSTNATIEVSEPLYFEGSAVADAISQCDIETFHSLLGQDSHLVNRVDENKCMALHMACDSDSIPERFGVEFVSILLENGADVNATLIEEDWTPLHEAASIGKS